MAKEEEKHHKINELRLDHARDFGQAELSCRMLWSECTAKYTDVGVRELLKDKIDRDFFELLTFILQLEILITTCNLILREHKEFEKQLENEEKDYLDALLEESQELIRRYALEKENDERQRIILILLINQKIQNELQEILAKELLNLSLQINHLYEKIFVTRNSIKFEIYNICRNIDNETIKVSPLVDRKKLSLELSQISNTQENISCEEMSQRINKAIQKARVDKQIFTDDEVKTVRKTFITEKLEQDFYNGDRLEAELKNKLNARENIRRKAKTVCSRENLKKLIGDKIASSSLSNASLDIRPSAGSKTSPSTTPTAFRPIEPSTGELNLDSMTSKRPATIKISTNAKLYEALTPKEKKPTVEPKTEDASQDKQRPSIPAREDFYRESARDKKTDNTSTYETPGQVAPPDSGNKALPARSNRSAAAAAREARIANANVASSTNPTVVSKPNQDVVQNSHSTTHGHIPASHPNNENSLAPSNSKVSAVAAARAARAANAKLAGPTAPTSACKPNPDSGSKSESTHDSENKNTFKPR